MIYGNGPKCSLCPFHSFQMWVAGSTPGAFGKYIVFEPAVKCEHSTVLTRNGKARKAVKMCRETIIVVAFEVIQVSIRTAKLKS